MATANGLSKRLTPVNPAQLVQGSVQVAVAGLNMAALTLTLMESVTSLGPEMTALAAR